MRVVSQFSCLMSSCRLTAMHVQISPASAPTHYIMSQYLQAFMIGVLQSRSPDAHLPSQWLGCAHAG